MKTAEIAIDCLKNIRKWFEVNENSSLLEDLEIEEDKAILWLDILYAEICKGDELSNQQTSRVTYICRWFAAKAEKSRWPVITVLCIIILSWITDGEVDLLMNRGVIGHIVQVLNNGGTRRRNISVGKLHVLTAITRFCGNTANADAIANSDVYQCLSSFVDEEPGTEVCEAAELLLNALPRPQPGETN